MIEARVGGLPNFERIEKARGGLELCYKFINREKQKKICIWWSVV